MNYKISFTILLISPILIIGGCNKQDYKPTQGNWSGKYDDSPFGIHGPSVPKTDYGISKPAGVDDYKDLSQIGAKWVRYAGGTGLVWDNIEKTKGTYDWSKNDYVISETYKQGIKIVISVNCFNSCDQGVSEPNGMIPKDMTAYKVFLEKAVERYDGDGIDDAPGSPVVDVWSIQNEVDGVGWKDTPEDYALLLKASYEAIMEANPKAKVAIGGLATPLGYNSFYVKVLNDLERYKGQQYFDIFDLHWSGQLAALDKNNDYKSELNYELGDFVKTIMSKMDEMNYKNVSFWITEMSDYEGSPKTPSGILEYKSESYQAAQVIKRYVYSLGSGVDKIFWVTLTEWHAFGGEEGGYFDNVGLINNPGNEDGYSHMKLSYYTYKKMVDILEGSDWNNIETIHDSGNEYVYKFTNKDTEKSVWVAWSDDGQGSVSLRSLGISNAKVTEAVPKYDSGKDVPDYSIAFYTYTTSSDIVLENKPVFIEEE